MGRDIQPHGAFTLPVVRVLDGIVSALKVLAAMLASGASLRALRTRVRKFPQTMINVEVGRELELATDSRIASALQAAEIALGSRGRVLLRASGTEPVIRVMVEGEDAALVEQQARTLAEVVRSSAA